MSRLSIYSVALVAALAVPLTARAGTVDFCGGAAGWSASWDASLDGLVQVIAADCSQLANGRLFIEKSAQFTQGPNGGVFPGIPIVFTQTAVTNVVRIIIEDEIITNLTGAAWTGFQMDVLSTGVAVFDPAATLVSGGPAPIGFSIAPFTVAGFANANTRLDISGGTVPNFTVWNPGSGASDGELHIAVTPNGAAPFATFTLVETPTPEPAALTLLSFGALAVIGRRRR